MTETSKVLSIIAYYLSEYDMRAVNALGYSTRKDAFEKISALLGRDNNYLKLRRDEFDALPESSSHRNGWNKRPAAKEVIRLAAYLRTFSFEELTEMTHALLSNQQKLDNIEVVNSGTHSNTADIKYCTEDELEQIINFTDETATVKVRTSESTMRVYNPRIILQLKRLYKGCCQICGNRPLDIPENICEAHHIDPFSNSHNNDASNIIILCPSHHRAIHKLKPVFDTSRLVFTYRNGREEQVKLNLHL